MLKMNKSMTILYSVKNGLYVNLTNRCPCACTFCIRSNSDHIYDEKDSLWLDHEPDFEEVKAAFLKTDMDRFSSVVFCGYGEPTEALDVLLKTAGFVKEKYQKKVRINTNGLGNLINKKDITPLFKGKIDAVSISLNSSNPEIYEKTVRPVFKEKAFPAMLDFAGKCKNYVPDVAMTTVSTTISREDEEECERICKKLGVRYRIRKYSAGPEN